MSTQTKHTPGPWFRGCKFKHGVQIVTVNDSGEANACLATVHHSTITPGMDVSDEVMANARLIAAAPELLAMLREYSADTRNLALNEEVERTEGRVTPWLVRHRRALAVIAKAEGTK